MTKAEYIALAETRFEALSQLQKQTDFYSYEKEFDQIWTDLGRAVLEQTIGPIPKDKRKKTLSVADMVNSK